MSAGCIDSPATDQLARKKIRNGVVSRKIVRLEALKGAFKERATLGVRAKDASVVADDDSCGERADLRRRAA